MLVGTAQPAQAAAGINQQINFQGRLLTASGAVVADGTYNMEFQIWQDGNGCVTGCTSANANTSNGGTLKWTEDWIYGTGSPDNRVTVKNGYYSVSLGSITSLSSVDFNQNTLWLSMNVGDTSNQASFATSGGYLIPFKRLASAVYALQAANSSALGNVAAANYVQFGTGTLQADNSTNSSIYFNKTNTGNLLQLQTGGTNAFVLDNLGNLQFGNNSDKTISVATASSANGNSLTVVAGSGNGTSKNGGNLVLEAGAATSGGTGGSIIVKPLTDSTAAFQIKNAAGNTFVSADSTISKLTVTSAGAPAVTGSELITTTAFNNAAWTSAGWTTTSTTAAHNTGNTSPLSTGQFSAVSGTTYQVTFTVTGSPTAGQTITPCIGTTCGQAVAGNTTGQVELITAGSTLTPALQFEPTTSTWNGTISAVSVKAITAASAGLSVTDATSSFPIELRSSGAFGNTFIGTSSGSFDTTGSRNTAEGWGALGSVTTGTENTASGYNTLQDNTTGGQNAAFGRWGLQLNTTGSGNTALGYAAGLNNVTGSNNTFLGAGASEDSSAVGALQNATAIGVNSLVAQSDSLVLGCINGQNSCTATTKVGIGTSAPTATLDVRGDTQITSASTTSFQVQGSSSSAVFTVDTSSNSGQGQIILGKPSTNKGVIVFDDSVSANTASLSVAGNSNGGGAFTLPNLSGAQTICTSNATSCSGTYLTAGNYLQQAPSSSATNTISPTGASTTGLIVQQTSTSGGAPDIFDVYGTSSATKFIQVTGTASNAGAINITSQGAGNAVTIQGAGNVNLVTNSASTGTIVKNSTNSTSGFQVQRSTGDTLLGVDTVNSNVNIQGANLVTPYGGLGIYQNLLKYTEQFDQAGTWAVSGTLTVAANSTSAPNNQTTADTLPATSSGASVAQTSTTAVANTNFTFSVWMRTSSGTQNANLRIDGSGGGTGTSSAATVTANWQRFSVTQNLNPGSGFSGNAKVLIFPGTTAGTGTVIAWGAQLEQASTPSNYAAMGNGVSTASQVFGQVVDGSALFRTSSDNSAAFQIQNSAGTNLFSANTSTGQLVVGSSNSLNGTLVFADSGDSQTITVGTDSSGSLNVAVPGGGGTNLPQLDYAAHFAQTAANTPALPWSNTYNVNGANNPNGNTDTYLLVGIIDHNSCTNTISSVQFNSTSMTLIGSNTKGTGSATCYYLYGLAGATGSHSLTISGAGTAEIYSVNVTSWYNVNQTTPYGSFQTAAGGFSQAPAINYNWPAGRVVVDNMSAYLYITNVSTSSLCQMGPVAPQKVAAVGGATSEVCVNGTGGDIFSTDGASYADSNGRNMQMAWTSAGAIATGFSDPSNSNDTVGQWVTGAVDLIGDTGGTATFGNSNTGGTSDGGNDVKQWECSSYVSTATGTVSSITSQFASIDTAATGADGVNPAKDAEAAVYSNFAGNNNIGGEPGRPLAQSSIVQLVAGANTFNMTSSTQVYAGTQYWLCITSNTNSATSNTLLEDANQNVPYEYFKASPSSWSFGSWPSNMSSTTNIGTFVGEGLEIYATVTRNTPSGTVMNLSNSGQLTLQNASDSTSAFQVQNASGNALINVDTQDNQVNINGALSGSVVRYADYGTGSGTFNIPIVSAGVGYNLSSNFYTSSGGGTYMSQFNITGLPQVEGTIVYIMTTANKQTTATSGNDEVQVEINGTLISSLTALAASGTGTGTTHEDYTLMYSGGVWHIVGYGPDATNGTTGGTNTNGTFDGADYAEYIDYSGDIAPQPGDVLTVGGNFTTVKDSTGAYDSHLMGVVSTAPYTVGGKDDGHAVVLALTGRVPVKVSAENGAISPGDPLTSSSLPGVAMKATKPGNIIGTALEAYDGTETSNEINVQLHVGYDDPTAGQLGDQIQGDMQLSGNLNIGGSATIGGDLTVAGTTTTKTLVVTGDANVKGGLTVGGTTNLADISVNGHIVTGGSTPTISALTAAGLQGASAQVDGNDTSGTVTITTGSAGASGMTPGDLAQLTFNKAFGAAPRAVVSANNAASAQLGVFTTSITPQSFNLSVAGKPEPNTTYVFTYIVLQ
ncbi:MAG TPA: hypothetical protein VGH44_06500 [Candidatus Saccharimonadia bacterium]